MTDDIKYTAQDLARHALSAEEAEVYMSNGRDMTVAELIVETCAVGYGGHYDEMLEDHYEGETIVALAAQLAPLYKMTTRQAEIYLGQIHDCWIARVKTATADARMYWKLQSFYVPNRTSPDNCPTCGRRITDFDELGCEAPDGQRWCIEHALEKLAELTAAGS
jgi:hypothetical protein